jgi:hypothetical protein
MLRVNGHVVEAALDGGNGFEALASMIRQGGTNFIRFKCFFDIIIVVTFRCCLSRCFGGYYHTSFRLKLPAGGMRAKLRSY